MDGIDLLRWVHSKLAADSALTALVDTRIYMDSSPQQNKTYPIVVISDLTNDDLNTVGGRTCIIHDVSVQGVDIAGGYDSVSAIAARIDAALQAQRGNFGSVTVLQSMRQKSYHYPEDANGVHYLHAGGVFRIIAEV